MITRVPKTRPVRHPERGSALVEMALVLPFMLILLFAIIDIGQAVNTRLVLTNVCREGGSIGCRQQPLQESLTGVLVGSARPLDLAGADGRVTITRIDAGNSADAPNPSIAAQYSVGGLAVSSGTGGGSATFGLTPAVHGHLVFDAEQGVADLLSVTVVEVWFKYRPISPLSNFIPGLLTPDDGGLIMYSRCVF